MNHDHNPEPLLPYRHYCIKGCELRHSEFTQATIKDAVYALILNFKIL